MSETMASANSDPRYRIISGRLVYHPVANVARTSGRRERVVSTARRVTYQHSGGGGNHRPTWEKVYGRVRIIASGLSVILVVAFYFIKMYG